ncbi:hypothetical protein V2J09_009274 [Rumex salicifolius]
MDMYGRNPGRQGSDPDPQPNWTDTGLQESMWRLGLASRETYPERPGLPDCVYYMRTGFCGFGNGCRYNHPLDRAAATMAMRLSGEEYPERPSEPPCQYYLRTGTCKFGATCKFHHPRDLGGSSSNMSPNYYGYPLRPGEKECSYYLKTGQCKFGITCKFDHPQPAGLSVPTSAPSFYPTVQSPSVRMPDPVGGVSPNFRVPRPPLLPGSYVSGAYGPMLLSSGVVPVPGWTSYSAPVSPALSPGAQPSPGASSLYRVAPLSTPTPPGPYSLMQSSAGQSSTQRKEVRFPERPGQPDCQYYLKTGDCKFGTSCRYHHPPERAALITVCTLTPLGLPLRPGEQTCAFYMRNGFCRFGPTCKFDHPMVSMKYSPSASSLTETPVTPYLAGPLIPTLPTSLSPDLSPEYRLGPSISDAPHSVRISSSEIGSSVSPSPPNVQQ